MITNNRNKIFIFSIIFLNIIFVNNVFATNITKNFVNIKNKINHKIKKERFNSGYQLDGKNNIFKIEKIKIRSLLENDVFFLYLRSPFSKNIEIYTSKISINDFENYQETKSSLRSLRNFKNTQENYYEININEVSEYIYLVHTGRQRFDGSINIFTNFEDLKKEIKTNSNINIIFIGGVLFLTLYNLLFFLITRRKSQLIYVCWNISFTFLILILNNFFYGTNLEIIQDHPFVFSVTTLVLFSLFARNFLKWAKNSVPKLFIHFSNIVNFLLIFLCLIETFLRDYIFPLGDAIDILLCLNLIIVASSSIIVYGKNKTLAKFFIISAIFNIIGGAVWFLYYGGFFDDNIVIRNALLIGSSLEIITVSLALAYEYKLLVIERNTILLEAREKKRYQSLVRILSHDISNPLSSASMTLEHFELFPDGKERIGRSLKRITQIIEEVRNEEKETSTANNLVPIQDAYESLKDMFEPRLTEKNIQFKLQAKNNFEIPMRENILVNNLLGNLLSNAIKFSYKNSDIILKVYEEDDNIILSMRDYGKGIKKEILEKLNNGEIVTSEGTDNEKGTGFGTDIVRNLLKNYEAKMEIKTVYHEDESVKDHGSEFMVTIPKIS